MKNIDYLRREFGEKWNVEDAELLRELFESYDYHAVDKLSEMFKGGIRELACRDLERARMKCLRIETALLQLAKTMDIDVDDDEYQELYYDIVRDG